MNRREFQFNEGSSNKFWSIELREQSLIVHYGKIGTNGQAQEKSFTSAEAAKKEHDKLVAEKTKKGYVEVQVGDASKSRPMPVVKHVEDKKEDAKPDAPVQKAKDAPQSVAAPTLATATVSLSRERKVRLEPECQACVSWLWQPMALPPARGFDYEACIKEALRWFSSYGYIMTHSVELPTRLTAEEAWFWIRAYDAGQDSSSPGWGSGWPNKKFKLLAGWERLLRTATKDPSLPALPAEDQFVLRTLASATKCTQWLPTLVPFFSTLELAEHLIDSELQTIAQARYQHLQSPNYWLGADFAKLVLIYESADERQKFRAAMAARFHREADPQSAAAQLALSFLAPVSGGAELNQYLASLPPVVSGQAPPHGCHNLFTLAGLPNEDSLVRETHRLAVQLPSPNGYHMERGIELTRLWLAATQWRQLDMITRCIVQGTSKDETAKFARVLALVEAPEAAPAMLEVLLNSKAPAVAAEWFAEHPLHSAVGLTPVAMGSGKAAEAAREVLHRLRRTGQRAVLEAALAHMPESAQAWLRREVIDFAEEVLADITRDEMPVPMAKALAALKPIKAPVWLQITSLPPIKISGKKLPQAEVERVLAALKDASLEAPGSATSLPALLKQHADDASLDTFAWKLFEQWLAMGAASKDKWALGAIGHIGGDACVLKLTPLVRDWPGESQHQRAVFGLEVLRAVGTDTALMSLNGIAQKLKFQGLKEKAKLMMEGIAQARGFTREQLADRIVPDCGLDEQGGRVFDFGPRQFKFVLGAEMKPLVRDAAGKMKTDLPSPNSSDDKEKAEAAVAAWKLLKKTLKEVLKIQAERLEDAMITGRRWTPEEFEMLIIKHPLMVNLARQLVFGSYSETGAVTHSYRITEDQSLADSNDDPCDLPGAGSIGVVHPAHLEDATKSAWGQVLSDYEIIPPFQQLGREICRAEPGDLELKEITRFKGPKIPGITVYGILERSHWVKDTPADAGGFMQHSKHFPSANVTAFIQYTGMGIGYYEEPQEIESVYFVPGHVKPDWWGDHKNKLPIRTVDPVVISEVLRLVRAIMAKAE
jgi:predicted DNA-binding WGR domain protein